MRVLPLSFDVRGKPVLVVGDGEPAAARIRLLEAAGADVQRLAGDRLDTLTDARLAFVALEDVALAELWAMHLRAAGLLVNVTDQPALCDFQVPALIDRGTVTIAIATGGASASLAKALRERLESWLPATLGPLAEAISQWRPKVAERLATPVLRRAFWDRLLAPGGALDPLRDQPDPESAIARALDGADRPFAGELQTLELASDQADRVTLRQLRLLQRADLLLHEADAPAAILDLARRDAARRRLTEAGVEITVAEVLAAGGMVLRLTVRTA
ncbi:precorrin-2 dehydrogenase/sirohydrochlorin ferrochelatase family protein [Parapedomonas caeni]